MPLPQRRGSILIVEDDRPTRDLYSIAFKAAGFHVIAVGDGAEALRVIDTATPTLILLDLGLPRVSGRDVAREVAARADTRHLPIVVVTGLDGDGLPPVACVLRKPVGPEVVVIEAEKCLSQSGRAV